MAGRSGWTLNRLVVLVVLGGFALLMIEVRYLHDEVLRHHAIAWAPIVYSGLMAAAIVVAVPFWDRGGRRALFWAFAAAMVVGPVGYWEHNEDRPWGRLERELVALTRPVGQAKRDGGHEEASPGPGGDHRPGGRPKAGGAAAAGADDESGERHGHAEPHEEEGGGPPALAPLSIAGLGLLGMLACARRLQPTPRPE